MAVKVKVMDRRLRHAFDVLDKPRKKLLVGVMSPEAGQPHPKDGRATIGEVALFSEFGTITQPARSWARDWADENEDNIARDYLADLTRIIFTTEKEVVALTKRGKQYVQQMTSRMKKGIPPENRPATLARKSGTTPLIDTGTLVDSVRYEVKD